jgi:DNA-binding XRE family transcriptional regulator
MLTDRLNRWRLNENFSTNPNKTEVRDMSNVTLHSQMLVKKKLDGQLRVGIKRATIGELKSIPEVEAGYRRSSLQYDVGKKIRQIRTAAQLTQRELASLAGTTQAVINRIESCQSVSNPTVEILYRLANACGFQPRVEFDQLSNVSKFNGV